jgi:REP element-mobilizing transposase RayT
MVPAGSRGVFHVVTRCVRRELLLERGGRQALLCRGLAGWLPHMGLDLLGYAVMGNHLHLVVRLRPDVVAGWSDAEVARHALAVLPVRSGPGLEPLAVTPALVARYAGQGAWIAEQRKRLSSPSWLLRLVKQEVARRANQEDGCTGHFWERRFTSVALLDAAAVLACLVYVDLNPLRAGLVSAPERSVFTGIRHRAARVRSSLRCDREAEDAGLGALLTAMPQCAPPNDWSGEAGPWHLSEAEYLELVDATARQVVRGKRGALPAGAAPMVERLGIEPRRWLAAMTVGGSMLGSVQGGPEARRRWAEHQGQRWVADKSGLW